MTDEERTPEDELGEELEMDGEDQDSGHDGAPIGEEDEDLDDELAEQEEEEEQERDEEAPRSSAALPPVRGNRVTAATTARAATVHSEDELPYIDDRVSKIWVGLIIAVFAAIFVYGLLLGRGGILTTNPSPEPTAPPPSVAPTAVPSQTARPSVTAGPTSSASPSVVVSPAPSRAPSPTAPSSVVPSPT